MSKTLAQTLDHGSTELAHRARAFYGLMAHIARLAGVNQAHVSRVVDGTSTSSRVLRVALRELFRAESGKFERKAA